MKTNYLAIVACAIANMVLGMGWYGIFSQQWMEGHGLNMESIESMGNPAITYGVSISVALISGYIIHLIFRRMGVNGWIDGLMSGAAIGLFGLLGTIVGNMYAMNPFQLSLIDGGFVFLQFSVFGAIIGGWQKK